MLANQLLIYLEGQIKQGGGRGAWSWGFQGDEHGAFGMPHPPEPPIPPVPPVPPNAADWRGLGRDLQEQIISMTRNTLKRALSNIDVEMSGRGTVRGADMRGEDLQRRNFAKGKLIGVNFSGANGESVNFEDAFLADVGLSDSNLTAANFSGARLERCRLDNAVLERANLGTAVLAKCDLSNANLTGANLQGTRLINPVLTGTILPDGSVWADGSDLRKFGATIVTRRIHIEIDSDDDDRQPDGDKLV
ncbi:MAG: pentapeptide repeat-containing protein [bacterium]|nr:pentapeptide repeat-containing protein [bacterium]